MHGYPNSFIRSRFFGFGSYVEDEEHHMPQTRLDEETYAKATVSLPILCTDAVIVDVDTRIFYLAKRRTLPMADWWVIGGRSFAGESPEASMRRCFKRETSLDLHEDRFSLRAFNRYRWRNRQQAPQDAGSDNAAYTFMVRLEAHELASVKLDPNEYHAEHGLEAFGQNDLMSGRFHKMLRDLWITIFG